MSPRTGRPIIGDKPKNKQIGVRVSEETVQKFQKCSEITGKPKVTLFEEMIDNLYGKIDVQTEFLKQNDIIQREKKNGKY